MKRNFPIWLVVFIILLGSLLAYNILSQKSDTLLNSQQSAQSKTSEPTAPQTQQSDTVDKSQVQTAPNFTLTDLNGKTVSLSDYKGKNIYINFWASWCGPCRLEMPDIEKIYQAYKDKELIILAVNIGESKDKVKAFMNVNELNFPVLLDTEGKAAKIYKVSSIPVSLFINKEGVVVGKQVGLMNYNHMESYIKELNNVSANK